MRWYNVKWTFDVFFMCNGCCGWAQNIYTSFGDFKYTYLQIIWVLHTYCVCLPLWLVQLMWKFYMSAFRSWCDVHTAHATQFARTFYIVWHLSHTATGIKLHCFQPSFIRMFVKRLKIFEHLLKKQNYFVSAKMVIQLVRTGLLPPRWGVVWLISARNKSAALRYILWSPFWCASCKPS